MFYYSCPCELLHDEHFNILSESISKIYHLVLAWFTLSWFFLSSNQILISYLIKNMPMLYIYSVWVSKPWTSFLSFNSQWTALTQGLLEIFRVSLSQFSYLFLLVPFLFENKWETAEKWEYGWMAHYASPSSVQFWE